jgi:hypothetical protein
MARLVRRVACVFQNGGTGVNIIVGQFDTARRAGHEAFDFGLEVRRLYEKALVGGQCGLRIAGSDDKLYYGRTKVAARQLS